MVYGFGFEVQGLGFGSSINGELVTDPGPEPGQLLTQTVRMSHYGANYGN